MLTHIVVALFWVAFIAGCALMLKFFNRRVPR